METKKKSFKVFYEYTLTMRSGAVITCVDAADPNEIPILMDMEVEGLSANGTTKTFVRCLKYRDALMHVTNLKSIRDNAYKTFKWHEARNYKMAAYIRAFKAADKAFDEALKIFEENYNI